MKKDYSDIFRKISELEEHINNLEKEVFEIEQRRRCN